MPKTWAQLVREWGGAETDLQKAAKDISVIVKDAKERADEAVKQDPTAKAAAKGVLELFTKAHEAAQTAVEQTHKAQIAATKAAAVLEAQRNARRSGY